MLNLAKTYTLAKIVDNICCFLVNHKESFCPDKLVLNTLFSYSLKSIALNSSIYFLSRKPTTIEHMGGLTAIVYKALSNIGVGIHYRCPISHLMPSRLLFERASVVHQGPVPS